MTVVMGGGGRRLGAGELSRKAELGPRLELEGIRGGFCRDEFDMPAMLSTTLPLSSTLLTPITRDCRVR